MALLNEKNLAGEAARRARFRVHHVGTKLNEAEVRELEALATKRSQTHAELIRGLILREIEQGKTRHRASAEMVVGKRSTDGTFTPEKKVDRLDVHANPLRVSSGIVPSGPPGFPHGTKPFVSAPTMESRSSTEPHGGTSPVPKY
jgi:hypothetical protein